MPQKRTNYPTRHCEKPCGTVRAPATKQSRNRINRNFKFRESYPPVVWLACPESIREDAGESEVFRTAGVVALAQHNFYHTPKNALS